MADPIRIGITIGDPAGIGPEIVAKALQRSEGAADVHVRVYGAEGLLPAGLAEIVDVLPEVSFADIEPGSPDPRSARLQLAALERAIEDARGGSLDAIVTAPWTKSLFDTIDLPAVGHTEVLAEAFDVADDHVMMLAGDVLRVSLVTTHVALADVPELVTPEAIARTVRITAMELRRSFGITEPRIAVCGLNPHASEGGHMGTEDLNIVAPTLAELRGEGHQVFGPFPADTLFVKFRGDVGPYDAVVAMYHDQGLTPLKLRHFGASANITLGLPIVRTSVDHGTAYDIAGKWVADESSMLYALERAVDMVRKRRIC